ncbi:MAG: low-complexity tail membrane protein [Phormidesmis sp.]
MVQLQQNRYLWVHFAALALVPLLLDFCLVGLASARLFLGYPAAYGFQFWLVALVCIGPPLWMQIARPFYIFSLPPVALKPDALTEDQRRCLTVLMSWQIKALAGVSAAISLWMLAQLYDKSIVVAKQSLPLMTPMAGAVTALVAFFFVCLFIQISVSAARSLLVSPTALKRVEPYEGKVAATFLILGVRVNKLLPSGALITAEPSGISPQKEPPEELSEDPSPEPPVTTSVPTTRPPEPPSLPDSSLPDSSLPDSSLPDVPPPESVSSSQSTQGPTSPTATVKTPTPKAIDSNSEVENGGE